MEWSKLKNMILLMLVFVNVILLLLVGSQARMDSRYQAETKEAALAVLEQGGISFLLEELPNNLSLPVVTVTRDRSNEAAVAAALLGEVSLQEENEVRPRYSGQNGTAEFSMNGGFTITLSPGVRTLEGRDYEKSSQACLEAMGFSGILADKALEDAETVLTYFQSWEGSPVFSCPAVLRWEGTELVCIEGARLEGTAAASAQEELLSTTTVLVRFLAGVNAGGYVCSQIEEMTPGYRFSSSTTRQVQLIPVWRFTTDTGVYYVDALTGAFSPAES